MGCGQALKHSTAPSPRKQCGGSRNAHMHFHISRSQLGKAPWDMTVEGGTAPTCPVAQVRGQVLHPKVWKEGNLSHPGASGLGGSQAALWEAKLQVAGCQTWQY